MLGAVVALSTLTLLSTVWAQDDADDDGTIFDITGDERKDPNSIEWENMPRSGQDAKIAYDKKIISLRKEATEAQQTAWDAAVEQARKVWAEAKTAFEAAKAKAAAAEAYEEATKLRNAIQVLDRAAEDTSTLDPLEVCVTDFISEDARSAQATYDEKIAGIGKELGKEVARIAGALDDKTAPPYKKFLDDLDAARKKAIRDGRPASAQKLHDALAALPSAPPANPPIVLEGQTTALKVPEPPEDGEADNSAATAATATGEDSSGSSSDGEGEVAAGEGDSEGGLVDVGADDIEEEEDDKPANNKRDRSKPLIELAKDKLSKRDYRAAKALRFGGFMRRPIAPDTSWISCQLSITSSNRHGDSEDLSVTVRYLCINDKKKKVVVKWEDTLGLYYDVGERSRIVGDVDKDIIFEANNNKLSPYNAHVEVRYKGVPIWETLWKKKGKVAKYKADGETFWFDDESLVVETTTGEPRRSGGGGFGRGRF
jgi:hypothetical protein